MNMSTQRVRYVYNRPGMCSGGRIVNYLKALLGDARHNVVFVGYQAKGTPGREIQTHGPHGGFVAIDGERIDIKAGIESVGGYSAHADQADLIDFVFRMREWPAEVRLVHGEAQAKRSVAQELNRRYERAGRTVLISGLQDCRIAGLKDALSSSRWNVETSAGLLEITFNWKGDVSGSVAISTICRERETGFIP